MSLDQGAEGRRVRAGLPNGSRAPLRATGTNNPGIGAAEAAARAELRRRRASAYRHLRTPRKRGRALRIVLIAITVVAAIGAGTVGAVFAGYNAAISGKARPDGDRFKIGVKIGQVLNPVKVEPAEIRRLTTSH